LDPFITYPSALRNTSAKEQLRRSPFNFSKLGETVVPIDEGLVGLGNNFQKLIIESRESTSEHAETAKMLFLKISRVDNLVGNMGAMVESPYATPTVWSSIASIGSDVQELLSQKAVKVDLSPLESRTDDLEVNLKVSTDKIKQQVVTLATGVGNRIGKVEKAVKHLIGK
jgi:hypothetical protein